MNNVNSCTELHYEQCGQQIQESHYHPFLLSACEPSPLIMLFKGPAVQRHWDSGEGSVQEHCEGYRSGGEAEGAVLVYFGEEELKEDQLEACNYMV